MTAQLEFLDSHNTVAYLIDPPEEHKSLFQSLIVGLNTCKIAHAISENPIIYESHVREFWANAQMDRRGNCITSMIQNKKIVVSEAVIREALVFGDDPRYPTKLDRDKIEVVLRRMGYEGKCPPYLKKMVHPYWRLLIHVMQLCLLAKKCGQDELNQVHASALVSLAMGWDYNFSQMLFDDMKGYVIGKKEKFLMVPRFVQMILNVKYPALEKTADTLDIKPMQSAVFGLMKQSRRSAKVSYQGLKPLEKFGNFPEIEGMEEEQGEAQATVNVVVTEERDVQDVQLPLVPKTEVEHILSSDDELTSRKRVTEITPLTTSLSLDVQVEAEEKIEPLVDPRPARRRRLRDHRFWTTSSNAPPHVITSAPSQPTTPKSSSRPVDDSTSSSTEYRAVQDNGKTKKIPVDVDVLQDKVFELERQNANIDAIINELLETQSQQAAKITHLEAQVGVLTASFMELKQQVTGKYVVPEEKGR